MKRTLEPVRRMRVYRTERGREGGGHVIHFLYFLSPFFVRGCVRSVERVPSWKMNRERGERTATSSYTEHEKFTCCASYSGYRNKSTKYVYVKRCPEAPSTVQRSYLTAIK